MNNETYQHQFEAPSIIGTILRKLHIDIPLFIALSLAAALSFIILYSSGGQDMGVLSRQAARIGLAFLLMTVLAHIDPNQFKRYSALLFGIGITLLLAVLIMGQTSLGAQRWLNLGLFRFQPSEMIKITTPMMVAWYLSEHPLPPRPKQLLVASILILLPTLLIAKQPDLGTAILVASSGSGGCARPLPSGWGARPAGDCA